MHLLIDLSKGKKANLSLLNKGKLLDELETESIITGINTLLKKHSLVLKDLEKIESTPGPGSYTGLKVGAAVANALNFSLGRKIQTIPNYDREK